MQMVCTGPARGSALLIAMVVVLLLAGLCTLLVGEMSFRAKRVEIDLEDMKAFEAAEAGIDAALHDINSSPVYQPYMESIAPNAKVKSDGVLNSLGSITMFSGVPLVGPSSNKPLTVHVTKKSDGSKPGCLGTSNWRPGTSLDDKDGNGRPTWCSERTLNFNGVAAYCEPNIQPHHTGHVAFFTYAIDWFQDGIDNDGDGAIDDRNERNKYTVYSTGIHRGISQNGVTESGKVVTIEVIVQAMDRDGEQLPHGAVEIQIKPRP